MLNMHAMHSLLYSLYNHSYDTYPPVRHYAENETRRYRATGKVTVTHTQR